MERISSFTGIGVASPSNNSRRGAASKWLASCSFSRRGRRKLTWLMSWVLKLTTSGGEIYSRSSLLERWIVFSTRNTNWCGPLSSSMLSAPRSRELETFLPSSTRRSTSVESCSVVAKTDTGKHNAIKVVTMPVFIGSSCQKTARIIMCQNFSLIILTNI